MSLRGGAYETLRNGVCTPNLCFLNARDQLSSLCRVVVGCADHVLGFPQSREQPLFCMHPANGVCSGTRLELAWSDG